MEHHKLNYVEYAARDLSVTKSFFEQAFDWTFEDYGPEYTAFSNQGLDGGFYLAKKSCQASHGGALLIFFSEDILATQEKVVQSGGVITQSIFNFPGGCRFHFTEPSGNEFAVWAQGDKPE